MFDIQGYHRAPSVEEAVRLLASLPDARIIAGGTDILVRVREGRLRHVTLVDIRGIAALGEIAETEDGGVRIGAAATFGEIIDAAAIARRAPLIAEAAATVGGPQLRNMATMGGNICAGVPCADSAGALLVLEAELEIHGAAGVRRVPATGFHLGPGRVALERGDVLTAFFIRGDNCSGWGAAYCKYAMRNAMDIATIGCAAAVRLSGDTFEDLRLAFSVAAPTPVRCRRAEESGRHRTVCAETLEAIRDAVAEDVAPRTSWRATEAFRLHIIRSLAGRIVRRAVERAGGTVR